MSETRLREEIVRFARSLFERGLTPGSSGNISLRLEEGGWLVTPTMPPSASSIRPASPAWMRRQSAQRRQADQGDSAARGGL
ncbi:MAG TPA: class II aldolase/adducin family protein [Dongiaceae bacterium]